MLRRNDRECMLCDINIAGFTCTDLALFLDTHPNNTQALECYQHYCKLQKELTKSYTEKYGPLTLSCMADTDGNEWYWGAMPLPWEGGC